ncbi:hypothetical protein, partial [Corynebacterium belfantii]|uniref:hypothetical protein n=1 Tax=Corynebacterium belfantii TaxID=2014537 RepID=UPI001A7F07F6
HQSNTKQSWNQPHPLRPKNQKENCQPNPQQTQSTVYAMDDRYVDAFTIYRAPTPPDCRGCMT